MRENSFSFLPEQNFWLSIVQLAYVFYLQMEYVIYIFIYSFVIWRPYDHASQHEVR
jgi:hypothetical protein